jgi:hypothetical protein
MGFLFRATGQLGFGRDYTPVPIRADWEQSTTSSTPFGPTNISDILRALRVSKTIRLVSICRETQFERISSLEEAADSSPGRRPGVGGQQDQAPEGRQKTLSAQVFRPCRGSL